MRLFDFSEFALTKSEMQQVKGQSGAPCKTGDCSMSRYDSSTGGYVTYYGQCRANVGSINPQDMDCFCSTEISEKAVPLQGGGRSACYA